MKLGELRSAERRGRAGRARSATRCRVRTAHDPGAGTHESSGASARRAGAPEGGSAFELARNRPQCWSRPGSPIAKGAGQDAHDLYVEMLDATPEFHLRHNHLFPLARMLDALGRSDEAFAALEEAHRSQVAYLKLTMPNAASRQSPPFRLADLCSDAADCRGMGHDRRAVAGGEPDIHRGISRARARRCSSRRWTRTRRSHRWTKPGFCTRPSIA